MMTQILTVFIKDKLLSIDGIGLDANKKDNNKKRNRSLQTVQYKFRKVSSERQLKRWEEQLQSGGSRTDKLSYISKFTYDKFTATVESGFMVHDIKRWLYKFKKK